MMKSNWPMIAVLFFLIIVAVAISKGKYDAGSNKKPLLWKIDSSDGVPLAMGSDSVLTVTANGSVWRVNDGSILASTGSSIDTIYDPMPQKERDALPKPLCIVRIIGGGTPMVGKDFIAVGCGGDFNRWEIWTKKDWAVLHKFWKAWEEAGKPMRSWIGNCEEQK